MWKKDVELHTKIKVKAVRLDNAPKLLEVANKQKRVNNTHVKPTTPYTSSQNGMAERAIQNTEQIARTILIEAQLPIVFQYFTVIAAAYITNRTTVGPTINEKRIIPYKTWFKK